MSEFKTKDLVLATYLKYKEVQLTSGYDSVNKSWVFGDVDTCEKISLELHNSNSTVEVLKYEMVRRNLLGMAHDSKK